MTNTKDKFISIYEFKDMQKQISQLQAENKELKDKLSEYRLTDEQRYMNFEQKLSDVIKLYEEELKQAIQQERKRCLEKVDECNTYGVDYKLINRIKQQINEGN